MSPYLCCLWLVAVTAATESATVESHSIAYEDVDKLLTKLLNHSRDNSIRPIHRQSQSLTVAVRFSVTSIDYLDVKNGEITVSGSLILTWADDFLNWNSSQYGGLTEVNLPRQGFWKPNVALEFDDNTRIVTAPFSTLSVSSNGTVRWITSKTFRSKCSISMAMYPFDSHVCGFKFLLPEYSSAEVELVALSETIGLMQYAENGEWCVTATTGKETLHSSENMDLSISALMYTVSITRRPQFVLMHVFAPLDIITCLNIVAYFVPVSSGERITYSVTLYLALVFSTTSLQADLPRNSIRISYFSKFVLSINIFIALGIIWSIMQVRLSSKHEEGCPIPAWLERVTASVLRIRRSLWAYRKRDAKSDTDSDKEMEAAEEPIPLQTRTPSNDVTPKDSGTASKITWLDVVEVLDMIYFDVSVGFLLLLLIIIFSLLSVENGSAIYSSL